MLKGQFVLLISALLFTAGAIGFFIWSIMRKNNLDYVLIIDKNNKFKIHRINLEGKTDVTVDKKTYNLHADCGMVNRKGKSLWVFSENKPNPLMIKYDKFQWLSSESIMNLINNKYIQQLMKADGERFKDMLLIYGAIAGLIGGICSVFVALKVYGIIH
jgi:hypothetical protein